LSLYLFCKYPAEFKKKKKKTLFFCLQPPRSDSESEIDSDSISSPISSPISGVTPDDNPPKAHPSCGPEFPLQVHDYILHNSVETGSWELRGNSGILERCGTRSVSQRGNAQNIQVYRDPRSGGYVLLAYVSRMDRVKRLHGRLTGALPQGCFKQWKFPEDQGQISSQIWEMLQPVRDYLPLWVDNKARRESFAASAKVFYSGKFPAPLYYFWFFFLFSTRYPPQKWEGFFYMWF